MVCVFVEEKRKKERMCFLPKCWATSKMSFGERPSTSSALRIGGKPSSNCTSTTAPITDTTRPLLSALRASVTACADAKRPAIGIKKRQTNQISLFVSCCWRRRYDMCVCAILRESGVFAERRESVKRTYVACHWGDRRRPSSGSSSATSWESATCAPNERRQGCNVLTLPLF